MLEQILSEGFSSLSTIEEIEIVNEIPSTKSSYFQIWQVNTEISVNGKYKGLILYIGFKETVPYTLPDIYAPEYSFGDFPHIESNHKLCLYEEGITYNISKYSEVIKEVLKRAKLLISNGLNSKNHLEFKTEILSYWCHSYKNDFEITSKPTLIYEEPHNTTLLYPHQIGIEGQNCILYSLEESLSFENKKYNRQLDHEALYIKDFSIWDNPPFIITGNVIHELLSTHPDFKIIRKYINSHKQGLLIFKFPDTSILCGIRIDSINVNKRGFRKGILSRYDVLTNFEYKNKPLKRFSVKLYNPQRLAERTIGHMPDERKFFIGGLGSIGSNLVHFLMSYLNSEFILVDNDILNVENIGRHLLGLADIGKFKVHALEKYIKRIRPEIKTTCIVNDLTECFNINHVQSQTAIILCTGSFMDEKYFLHKLQENKINTPVFILWLEPYGAAGHMIYINETNYESYYQSLFDSNNNLYVNNIISTNEYVLRPEMFTKNETGCNGTYTNYGGNDVIMFLCEMIPIMNRLINNPENSQTFRWIGNINQVKEKGIKLNL